MRTYQERNDEMWQMFILGKSQKDIAHDFGMTQGRVSQILKKYKNPQHSGQSEEVINQSMENQAQ